MCKKSVADDREVPTDPTADGGGNQGLGRLIELAMMKRGPMIAAVVLSVLSTVASFVPYIAIYLVIKEIILVYPAVDTLDTAAVFMYAGWALLGVLANIVFYLFSVAFSHIAAYGTLYQLKIDFLEHLSQLPLGYFIKMGTGKLREVTDGSIESLEGFIAHDFANLVSALTAPIVMLVMILAVDWRFGLVAVLGIVISFVLYGITSTGEDAKRMVDDYQAAQADMGNASTEYIRGIGVIKAFQQTANSFRSLQESIRNYTESVTAYSLSQENMTATLTTAFSSIYLLLIPVGIFIGSHTDDYQHFVSAFIFYLMFTPVIGSILMRVIYAMANTQQFSGAAQRMDSILAEDPLVERDVHAHPEGYEVRFDDVSFSYDEDARYQVLSNVSFVAPAGQVTAIVGPSGGGKSTIASLIARFWDVDTGSIRIGGADVRDIDIDELMQTVSSVFQDSFMFSRSIADNIRVGREDASDEEVIAAAQAAQCHEFISVLPEGYDTVYGSAGVRLSGGQIQRLAIARAIVKDSPVLVLDEATAFADAENERLIQQALEALVKDRTVIMIAHRLSTVRNADNILVVQNGEIVESGVFDELMSSKGQFKRLWDCYIQAMTWKLKGGEVA